jgi:hypothetical protein
MVLRVTGYNNKLITSTSNTKFLCVFIENSLSWKAHVDQLITNLCTACYAIRPVKPFNHTIKLVLYSYFHSLFESWNNILGKFPKYSCPQTTKKSN